MVLNLICPFDKFKIADSFSMLIRLNDSFHVFDQSASLSRYTNTDEFKSRSWKWIVENSLRVLKTSLIWQLTLNFRISFIAIFIILIRWLIVKKSAFNSVICEYASNTNKIKTSPCNSIESLIVFNVICKFKSGSIPKIFETMIK